MIFLSINKLYMAVSVTLVSAKPVAPARGGGWVRGHVPPKNPSKGNEK